MLIMNFIEKKPATPLADSWKGLYWGNVLLIIAASISYLLLMEPLGYLLATFGFMLVLFGLGKMKIWVVLSSAMLAALGSYYIFHTFLKVPLPRGILSF
jgi:putative tricarboxylic transport membrane protein